MRNMLSGSKSRFAVLALVALGMIAAAGTARAAMTADVRAGLYPNADAVSLGGGVLTGVGDSGRWFFNPNLDVAMGDRRNVVAMSGDFHYDVATRGHTQFWMGAGPAVLVSDWKDVPSSETHLGINVLTGLGAKSGTVRPFAQLRGTMSNDSQVTLSGGVRF
jgi:hypothetical protein